MLLIERGAPERFGAESGPLQVALGEDFLEAMGGWFGRNTSRGGGPREAGSVL